MLLVVEREEARVQEFQEVSALLLAALEREQRNEARRRLLAALRARAVIRDVVDLGTLVP
ncbi:MAG: hypothetical protein N2688_11095 [Burkholderiaceae bacterium]|nr:hypothetical protein [Burkholderiaceae bacterium]